MDEDANKPHNMAYKETGSLCGQFVSAEWACIQRRTDSTLNECMNVLITCTDMYCVNLHIESSYWLVDIHNELAYFHTLAVSQTMDHALRFVDYTAGGAVSMKPTEFLCI